MSKYSLEVTSHHKEFDGKSLHKYHVDGIDTIGVYGNEEFEIRFKNNTGARIQVRLTLDGTDILTGEKASKSPEGKMWLVNAYQTLSLRAFPETNDGGAAFVFTNEENSVALHTHGDQSSKGIIAAAVFTESYVAPLYTLFNNTYPGSILRRNISESNLSLSNNSKFKCSSSIDSLSDISNDTTLSSTASVGAGDFVEQKIKTVTGLVKPILDDTIRVRYVWWDELKLKLKDVNYAIKHASGFPADKEETNINLSNVPKVKTNAAVNTNTLTNNNSNPEYSRVY